jgi:hypothetical protein
MCRRLFPVRLVRCGIALAPFVRAPRGRHFGADLFLSTSAAANGIETTIGLGVESDSLVKGTKAEDHPGEGLPVLRRRAMNGID